ERAVVPAFSCIKVPTDLPLTSLAMLGCATPTGWGAAIYTADIRPGDVVAVLGVGGVGINAVQGARMAGARSIIAIDNVKSKLDLAKGLGATHVTTSHVEAKRLSQDLTEGHGIDAVIVAAGVPGLAEKGFELLRKGGKLVLTALGNPET